MAFEQLPYSNDGLRHHEDMVYTFDSRIVFDNVNPLVVAVHPFFIKDNSFVDNYPLRADHFLRNYQGPVFILEEDVSVGLERIPKIDQTLERIHRFGTVPERYFVMTEASDPEPQEVDWIALFDLLNHFKPSEIKLMGGLNRTHRSANERGCLGYLRYKLRREGFNVTELPDLIFTPESLESKLKIEFQSFVYNSL